MARGSIAKEEITKKILETFEGSFLNEKEIRIPIVENGETIQIKVALTAAKVNVECGNPVQGSTEVTPPASREDNIITEAEKEDVKKRLASFGF